LLTKILYDTTGQLYIIGSKYISSILPLVVNLQPVAKIPVKKSSIGQKINKNVFWWKRGREKEGLVLLALLSTISLNQVVITTTTT
jgi:hypothetical protein